MESWKNSEANLSGYGIKPYTKKSSNSRTEGNCCFNHIVGLTRKGKKEFPLFDYEKLLYDSLLISEFNNPLN